MITCPECKHEFSPDQSLRHQLDHMMQEERAILAASFSEKQKILDLLKKELTLKESSIDQLVTAKLKSEKIKLKSELENEKELITERSKIESAIVAREGQRSEMKLAEREKQLNDLRKKLEEAKRKAEQGSIQTQGEVQELALQDLLSDLFKFDSIQEVPKDRMVLILFMWFVLNMAKSVASSPTRANGLKASARDGFRNSKMICVNMVLTKAFWSQK